MDEPLAQTPMLLGKKKKKTSFSVVSDHATFLNTEAEIKYRIAGGQ